MRRIGRYQIVRELGRGSMGVVYLAVDPRIGRKVALKTIRLPEGLSPADVTQYRERFRREGMAAGKLNHPHIVTVHDVGDDGETGASFIVMEYIEGETLRDRIRSAAPLPEDEVRRVGAQLAEALEYAHQQGVIHRDIKPANVLLGTSGEPKIMDFGIARVVDSELTRDEQAIGSPAFMSPEQIRGERIGRTSDFFSLGVLLYQMATGRKPFEGRDTATVMYRILNEEPLAPSAMPAGGRRRRPAGLSADLDRILLKLLRKKPSERYSGGRDLIADLGRRPAAAAAGSKRRRKGTRRRKRPAAPARAAFIPRAEMVLAGGGGLLLVAALLLWGWRSGRAEPAPGGPDPGAAPAPAESPADPGRDPSFWSGWFGADDEAVGTVEIRFSHHLPSGTLTVWMDGDRVLRERLRADREPRKLFGRWRLEKPGGLVTETIEVEEGRHRFEASVESDEAKLSLRAEREVELRRGMAGRLVIDLDQWFGKQLQLKWK